MSPTDLPAGLRAAIVAALIIAALLYVGDPLIAVQTSPGLAFAITTAVIAIASWLFGAGVRGYLHGRGRQPRWAYLGHSIRGHVDTQGQLWISLSDCQQASGLELLPRLGRVPAVDRCEHPVKGWMVTRSGLLRVLDGVQGDRFAIGKLKLFVERDLFFDPSRYRDPA